MLGHRFQNLSKKTLGSNKAAVWMLNLGLQCNFTAEARCCLAVWSHTGISNTLLLNKILGNSCLCLSSCMGLLPVTHWNWSLQLHKTLFKNNIYEGSLLRFHEVSWGLSLLDKWPPSWFLFFAGELWEWGHVNPAVSSVARRGRFAVLNRYMPKLSWETILSPSIHCWPWPP